MKTMDKITQDDIHRSRKEARRKAFTNSYDRVRFRPKAERIKKRYTRKEKHHRDFDYDTED